MMFSIIIPVYNGSSYILRCIDSITKQTYHDYEIIIVDDGSTDDSWQVMNSISNDSIHCYQIEHSGAGATRNTGLKHAKGDYILFIDVDDYYNNDTLLEILEKKIQQNQTDVFMYQMIKVTEQQQILERYRKPEFFHDNIVLSLGDVYQDLVITGQVLASSCNKCIRRELIEEYSIYFLEGVYAEDIDWVIHLFSHVSTICLLNIDGYAYTQHKTVSRSTIKDAPNDIVAMIEKWSYKLSNEKVPHARAVAGFVAFEYGICMGNNQYLSKEKRKVMKQHEYLLKYGLDKKTKYIYKFYSVFGYSLTCLAIRFYLFIRRIW